jgi:hypothetical protein
VQTLQSAKFLPKTSIALKTFNIMCGVKMQWNPEKFPWAH